jgi:hypothetical protein
VHVRFRQLRTFQRIKYVGEVPILLQKSFCTGDQNFPGFRRDFRVKMWGTSSPDDKLADDLGNAIEGTRISGRQSDSFTAGKLASGNRGLLQQYQQRPAAKM